MPKKEYKVTENGNQVTIEIHTAGTVSKNKDLIDSLINKWKQENPNKKIIGDPQIISGASGIHKRAVIDSMRFSWEQVQTKLLLEPSVSKSYFLRGKIYIFEIETREDSNNFLMLKALIEIAKQDFPNLRDEEIVIYADEETSLRIKFGLRTNSQPAGYKLRN